MDKEKTICEIEKLERKVQSFVRNMVFAMLFCDVIVYHISGRMWFTDIGPAYGFATMLIGCLLTELWYTAKLKKLFR